MSTPSAGRNIVRQMIVTVSVVGGIVVAHVIASVPWFG